VVVKGDSSIGRDGFNILLVAVDGGMHFARRVEERQSLYPTYSTLRVIK